MMIKYAMKTDTAELESTSALQRVNLWIDKQSVAASSLKDEAATRRENIQ